MRRWRRGKAELSAEEARKAAEQEAAEPFWLLCSSSALCGGAGAASGLSLIHI